jgi:hypothetical protein
MADIVLAECRGQAWLVSGEQYIDHLLANTLPPHVTIELVPCESKSEVDALWVQHCGPPEEFSQPWLIHPRVTQRVRRGTSGHSVFFAQWSAMMDDDAKAVVRAAAGWALENPDRDVTIVRYVGPNSPQAMLDLANLRASLVEAQLVSMDIEAGRIGRETRDVASVPGMAEESQRVDIVLKAVE